jgi:hypothetical protein
MLQQINKSSSFSNLVQDFMSKIKTNLTVESSNNIPNLTILAVNPFNYRTVVSFNFDKVTNQCYWDNRILKYYNLIMRTTCIDKSFIGLRINVNEDDEFMLKLNVSSMDVEKIDKFYQISSTFVNVKSFYYEKNELPIHFARSKTISISLNGFRVPISPNSFIQANHIMGNILYDRLAKLVRPNKNVIIYGRNSFHIASQIYKKFGIIKCLNPCPISYQDGLEIIKIHDLHWDCINSKESLFEEMNILPDDTSTTIIMSPGRSGYCYFDKINLSKLKNKQIFYITCNIETMKNDIKDNFIITNNIMVELFPGTIYNEHIVELSLNSFLQNN